MIVEGGGRKKKVSALSSRATAKKKEERSKLSSPRKMQKKTTTTKTNQIPPSLFTSHSNKFIRVYRSCGYSSLCQSKAPTLLNVLPSALPPVPSPDLRDFTKCLFTKWKPAPHPPLYYFCNMTKLLFPFTSRGPPACAVRIVFTPLFSPPPPSFHPLHLPPLSHPRPTPPTSPFLCLLLLSRSKRAPQKIGRVCLCNSTRGLGTYLYFR